MTPPTFTPNFEGKKKYKKILELQLNALSIPKPVCQQAEHIKLKFQNWGFCSNKFISNLENEFHGWWFKWDKMHKTLVSSVLYHFFTLCSFSDVCPHHPRKRKTSVAVVGIGPAVILEEYNWSCWSPLMKQSLSCKINGTFWNKDPLVSHFYYDFILHVGQDLFGNKSGKASYKWNNVLSQCCLHAWMTSKPFSNHPSQGLWKEAHCVCGQTARTLN